ncbi:MULTISPECIES: hypothetical protein [Paraburkholderia]|nr:MULTISPECIES: hypothetical protein [Paraburkholderia]MCX4176793.1 hypothetical protein [Paraburkholderia madseniana]MDQ6464784.1 hypothetical protein [Paraburkholderia madseniana]
MPQSKSDDTYQATPLVMIAIIGGPQSSGRQRGLLHPSLAKSFNRHI